jgi:hypothetical protein
MLYNTKAELASLVFDTHPVSCEPATPHGSLLDFILGQQQVIYDELRRCTAQLQQNTFSL